MLNAHLLVAGEEEAEGLATIARRAEVATRERVAVPLLTDASASIRVKVAQLFGQYKVYEAEGILLATTFDEMGDSAVRRAALHSLALLDSPLLGDALEVGLASTDESVRLAALERIASTTRAEAVPLIRSVLAEGSAREQQVALRALADIEGEGGWDASFFVWGIFNAETRSRKGVKHGENRELSCGRNSGLGIRGGGLRVAQIVADGSMGNFGDFYNEKARNLVGFLALLLDL